MLFQKLENGTLKLWWLLFCMGLLPLASPCLGPVLSAGGACFCFLREAIPTCASQHLPSALGSISLSLILVVMVSLPAVPQRHQVAETGVTSHPGHPLTPVSAPWLVLRQGPGWAHSLEQGSGSALGTKGRNPGCVARCTHQTLPCGSSVTTSCVGPPGS